MRSSKKKSVIGDPIKFRGMAHAPTNEAGVVRCSRWWRETWGATSRYEKGTCLIYLFQQSVRVPGT